MWACVLCSSSNAVELEACRLCRLPRKVTSPSSKATRSSSRKTPREGRRAARAAVSSATPGGETTQRDAARTAAPRTVHDFRRVRPSPHSRPGSTALSTPSPTSRERPPAGGAGGGAAGTSAARSPPAWTPSYSPPPRHAAHGTASDALDEDMDSLRRLRSSLAGLFDTGSESPRDGRAGGAHERYSDGPPGLATTTRVDYARRRRPGSPAAAATTWSAPPKATAALRVEGEQVGGPSEASSSPIPPGAPQRNGRSATPSSQGAAASGGVSKALAFSPLSSRGEPDVEEDVDANERGRHGASVVPSPGRISTDAHGVEIELLGRQLTKAEAAADTALVAHRDEARKVQSLEKEVSRRPLASLPARPPARPPARSPARSLAHPPLTNVCAPTVSGVRRLPGFGP